MEVGPIIGRYRADNTCWLEAHSSGLVTYTLHMAYLPDQAPVQNIRCIVEELIRCAYILSVPAKCVSITDLWV